MPDTFTPIAAGFVQSSTIDPADALWRSVVTAHDAFNAQARATVDTDPGWESPIFQSLSEATRAAEASLMDLPTATPLGILRKLELLFERMNWKRMDVDEDERRIVGGIITDLRRHLGHPVDGTDDINVTRKWEPN